MAIHSRYGGSKIGVIIACAGYLNATKGIIEPEGKQAKIGTAAHAGAEFCLKTRVTNAEFIKGATFYGCEVDDEMVDGINVYLRFVENLKVKYPDAVIRIEPKVRMSSVVEDDPNVFGYVDCLILVIDKGVLYVIDFKFGRVIVDVVDNAQIAHYAISALDTYKLWYLVDKVVGVIIQPRQEHVDGYVRETVLTIDELMVWRDKIVDGIRASKHKDAVRTAGAHCKYCPIRGECRARIIHTLSLTFSRGGIGNLTDDELAMILPELPAVEKNIQAIKDHALTIARAGTSIAGYKLVRPSLQSKCSDVPAFIREMKLANPDFDESTIYNPGRMKGKTILKKECDPKIVQKYFPTPDASSALVELSNPKAAISVDAAQAFEGITL